jgi:hypothetical protein
MQGHERYEELCALSAIGQLAEDETEELHEHLGRCEACKDVQGDYALILDQLPSVAAASPASTAQIVGQARREQFIQRAQVSGISFTSEAVSGRRRGIWRNGERHRLWYKASFAMGASAVVVLMIFYNSVGKSFKTSSQSQQVASGQHPAVEGIGVPRRVTDLPTRERAGDPSVGEATQKQVKALQEEVKQLRSEREQANTELASWRSKVLELSSKSEVDARALQEARERLATLESAQGEMVAAVVEKELKIRDLSGEISGQTLAAERERELNAAARDVRELMAARNLHIIDVADVDGRGKARKSFGRVFYVEGQTLLFYAFDLGETASRSKVLFQAWGQQEGAGGKPRNLGVFRVDDQAQKRWVLRVDDPKLLVSIDSLFVTIEPSPGMNEPTGRRLIYAYLGTPANHP